MINGIALHLRKTKRIGAEPTRMNLETLSLHFKLLNLRDIIGMFETISNDNNIMITKSMYWC